MMDEVSSTNAFRNVWLYSSNIVVLPPHAWSFIDDDDDDDY
jgi:hypothetical protein